ncbi:MAG: two-component system, NarL family, nitrate/nitrite response regulator NarL [Candidatus Binatota bacterium]|nr:two-component system, NarL family, nitrate/nitrite response regulator NarL [Candidatus Binatota bacterium]
MAGPLRILIADDHALFRQGLRSLLALQDGMEVVAETESAANLPRLLDETPCDVLLLDLQMERNSLADVRSLAEKVAVIVVTSSERPEDAFEAIRAGARGVVLKRFAVENLIEALEAVRRGEAWMPTTLQTYLAAGMRGEPGGPLSPREREITRWVALGLRNSEVARKLFISEQTVKTHLNNIFQKLGFRDRVELALYAVRVGLVGIHERVTGE